MKYVITTEKSKDAKTGEVSVTWSPSQSCPSDCPLKDNGCYADSGNCGIHKRRISQAAEIENATQDQIAKSEAYGIRQLSGKRPLRLHVAGDCATDSAADTVSAACQDYRAKHRQPIWCYTHAWKDVSRTSWRNVAVLASCESMTGVKAAFALGYATALIVPESFKGVRRVDGFRLVTCKHTTNGTKCIDCKLCFDDKRLRRSKTVVCFASHGSKKNAVKAMIEENSNV